MKTYKYVEVGNYNAALSLKLKSLDDFSRFLDQYQYRQLFLLLNEENMIHHFAVTHQGALVYRESEGFQTMEDYHAALKMEFPSAVAFYEARVLGCKNYNDYSVAMRSGTDDIKTIIKLRDSGFIEGFILFTEMKKTCPVAANINVTNALQLYNWAMAANFQNFNEMKEGLLAGFTEAIHYRVALEKGYTNAGDYEEGEKGNFINASDWTWAKEVKAKDHNDLGRYVDLQMLKSDELNHDEKCLLVLLSKLPQNKKISANKLGELFRQQTDAYRYTDSGQLPEWFTTSFSENFSFVDFLLKNEEARRYGTYDKDGEYFETHRLQERKVVVDGSNVAYNSQQGKSDCKPVPLIANITRMVNALKEKGFTEITVISDASLVHRVADRELLPELEKQVLYFQAPAESSADAYMIDYVKACRCLLVSNDVFRDWKLKDPWIAQNIDYYQLSFLLSDESVLLPDVDNER